MEQKRRAHLSRQLFGQHVQLRETLALKELENNVGFSVLRQKNAALDTLMNKDLDIGFEDFLGGTKMRLMTIGYDGKLMNVHGQFEVAHGLAIGRAL